MVIGGVTRKEPHRTEPKRQAHCIHSTEYTVVVNTQLLYVYIVVIVSIDALTIGIGMIYKESSWKNRITQRSGLTFLESAESRE